MAASRKTSTDQFLSRREVLKLGGASLAAASLAAVGRSAPPDTTMRLSVEGLQRAQRVPVHDASGGEMEEFSAGVLHLRGTGFPWQENSNTYLSGHRLGYPDTESYRVFHELDTLRAGALVELEDSAGHLYHYRVYDRFTVDPDNTRG